MIALGGAPASSTPVAAADDHKGQHRRDVSVSRSAASNANTPGELQRRQRLPGALRPFG
jgi:hypothetical protein